MGEDHSPARKGEGAREPDRNGLGPVRTAAKVPPMRAAAAQGAHPIARACGLVAVLAIVWFVWTTVQRIGYPYELEWMEGAMVDHALRVRDGLPVYCPPTLEHVAFLYTPLLFQLGAACTALVGEGPQALRLVSAASALATMAVLYLWVRRETGQPLQGLLAAGLYAAGHGYLRSWYDLARNDSLLVLFLVLTAWLVRMGTMRTAILAGLGAMLAFLSKQTAVMWLPALGVGALFLDWRRGLAFCASAAACTGIATAVAHAATDGWFTFFVFEMPRGHGTQDEYWVRYWTDDLLPLLPALVGSLWLCGALWRESRRGEALFLAALGGAGLLTSYLSRLHAGGYDNVLVFALLSGVVLLAQLPRLGGRARTAAAWLVALQFALLLVDVRALWQPGRPLVPAAPSQLLPKESHRVATEQLVAWLRAQPGEVLVPFHGHLPKLAGKRPSAHGQALADVMQRFAQDLQSGTGSARSQAALQSMITDCERAFGPGGVDAVLLELPHGPVFESVFGRWLTDFERSPVQPLADPLALQPVVGMVTNSPYVLVRKPR